MSDKHSLFGTLHEVTHRVPGVPEHVTRPAGHQGRTHHDRPTTERRSTGRTGHHAPGRPPRVLVAWQRRVAAFFGQELR
jgi:hypothetical protein